MLTYVVYDGDDEGDVIYVAGAVKLVANIEKGATLVVLGALRVRDDKTFSVRDGIDA
jgi:hypothetical protein